jgi:ABC-type nitrate/sulfonate/bicarbonate transport system substrate-binding protein
MIIGIGVFYFNIAKLGNHDKYPVTIAVSKTPLSSPFFIAKAINAYDDTCVEVKYSEVIGGQAAFKKVIDEEVDFGTSSDSVMAFQSLNNHSFVTHAMFVQSDNDAKLITRTSDNIQSISELKNKRIGLTKGTSSEYLLSTLLAIEGLTMEDVELYHYKPEQLVQAFRNGDVDAILPWEPFAFQASQLLGNEIKIHDTKSLGTLTFNLISQQANSQLVDKARCIIQGLKTAINYIASNPEESKKIILNKLGSTPEFIDWIWPDYIFKLGLNQSLLLNIQSQVKWAVETQMRKVEKTPSAERYIDSRALLIVEPGAVHLPL